MTEELQEHLLYTTNRLIRNYFQSKKLRGVSAFWREEDNTACMTFYFEGEVSEEDREEASDVCAGIIANFPYGLLEEQFVRWDYPKPLPEEYLAYNVDEKSNK